MSSGSLAATAARFSAKQRPDRAGDVGERAEAQLRLKWCRGQR